MLQNTCPEYIYGVLGYPLGHSLSPCLHNFLLKQAEVPGAFYKFSVLPDNLEKFMSGVKVFPVQGLCVTIPHKVKILDFLDELDTVASKIGAVNTVYWQNGKLCGTNTDAFGFLYPLLQYYLNNSLTQKKALVLGAGGASRAVLYGLNFLGLAKIYLLVRDKHKAEEMAFEFNVELIDSLNELFKNKINIDLVVNTTPVGMYATEHENNSLLSISDFCKLKSENSESSDFDCFQQPLAYDLVYRPLSTVFLNNAKKTGWHTQDGLVMFAAQALKQFNLWTGFNSIDLNEVYTYLKAMS